MRWEGNMLDESLVIGDIFGLLCDVETEKLALIITKFLGGKSVKSWVVKLASHRTYSIRRAQIPKDRWPYNVFSIVTTDIFDQELLIE